MGLQPSGAYAEFAISTPRLADGTVVVAAGGELDLYTAPDLEQALAVSLDEGAAELVVDLSAASFVDSTALRVVLGAARRLQARGGELTVLVTDPNVRKVFEITGFDRLFRVAAP